MKSIIISLFTVALLIPLPASAQEKKGDTATVPNWTWVSVKNPEPVKNGNNEFGYGRYDKTCRIQHGGTVTVVGIDRSSVTFGRSLLVRYSIDGTQYGTNCPSGVLFFLSPMAFSKMEAEYRRVQQLEQAEKDLVKRLIEN